MKTLLLAVLLAGCGALTPQDKADLGEYSARQQACVAALATKAEIDACRASVKAEFCAKWAGRFDAGVCQ